MTKDEYIEKLTKYYEDNKLGEADSYDEGYTDGLTEVFDYAIILAERLDGPKKVVIPQFVADWIENARIYYGDEVNLLGIVYWIRNYCADIELHYEWLKNIDNQKLLLNAIASGYEVEKEPKYYVKIKHFDSSDNTLYVNHYSTRGDFFLDNKKQSTSFNTIFTKSYLKQHWTGYEAYNNAGLLEFEEVEDE